jgi:hypothetical protein
VDSVSESVPFRSGVATVRLDHDDVGQVGLDWLLGGDMRGATAAALIKFPPGFKGTWGQARPICRERTADGHGAHDAGTVQVPHSDGVTAAIVPIDAGYEIAMYVGDGLDPTRWPIPLGARARLEACTIHGGAPLAIDWTLTGRGATGKHACEVVVHVYASAPPSIGEAAGEETGDLPHLPDQPAARSLIRERRRQASTFAGKEYGTEGAARAHVETIVTALGGAPAFAPQVVVDPTP